MLFVNVCDGEWFPDVIARMEGMYDFNGLTSPGITRSPEGSNFDKKIMNLVREVCKTVKNAPLWSQSLYKYLEIGKSIVDSLQPIEQQFEFFPRWG